MADIFLSYSKERRRLTEELARDLEAEGFAAWWDTSLLPADNFRVEIDRQLDQAKAVVIIWTQESVRSKRVKSVQRDRSWETIILDDFDAMRRAGLSHALMDEVEQKFGQ